MGVDASRSPQGGADVHLIPVTRGEPMVSLPCAPIPALLFEITIEPADEPAVQVFHILRLTEAMTLVGVDHE